MRAILQRVSTASVTVEEEVVGKINTGLLVLLGVTTGDTEAEAKLLADKTIGLRIFSDEDGRFNLSLKDIGAEVLVVSQFTLYADMRKGRRPSFLAAADPEVAEPLVQTYVEAIRSTGTTVETGIFGAMMHVSLVNDGPVTIILDSDTFKQPRSSSTNT